MQEETNTGIKSLEDQVNALRQPKVGVPVLAPPPPPIATVNKPRYQGKRKTNKFGTISIYISWRVIQVTFQEHTVTVA